MFRKYVIFLIFCIAFFYNVENVYAAFDLNITNAIYDSNTGYLTIHDSNFSEKNPTGYYSTSLPKIKLGGILITGSYQFNSGVLKINISNKDSVNEHINSSQNDIIQNGLYFSDGAISKNTYPPNSIDGVTLDVSKEKTINLNVIKLTPKITVDSFTSNILTMNNNGGEIIVTITGDNLDTGLLKVHNLNSSSIHSLTINRKIATARINISANYTTKNRTDTFALYLNGHQTDKTISVNVLPMKSDSSDINSDTNNNNSNNNDNSSNDNNISNDNNNNSNNNDNSSNDNNISNDNNNNSSESSIIPDDDNSNSNNDNADNTNNKDFLVEESNNQTSEKGKYIILLPMIIIIIGLVVLTIKLTKFIRKPYYRESSFKRLFKFIKK